MVFSYLNISVIQTPLGPNVFRYLTFYCISLVGVQLTNFV